MTDPQETPTAPRFLYTGEPIPASDLCVTCGRESHNAGADHVFALPGDAPSSAPPAVPSVEEARAEAERRYERHAVDFDGWYKARQDAFVAGAEWAREAEGEVERLRAALKLAKSSLELSGYGDNDEPLKTIRALAESESIGDDGTR